jgi:hypothetical protein
MSPRLKNLSSERAMGIGQCSAAPAAWASDQQVTGARGNETWRTCAPDSTWYTA